MIGNILDGFDTLNPNNVKVLRDGTIKPNEKKKKVEEEKPGPSKPPVEETCIIVESTKGSCSESEEAREICNKNKKRRKIRFHDETERGYKSDDEVYVDPETNKKVSQKLKKGYFEAMRKKKEEDDLKKSIEEMKNQTMNTNVNHHASLFKVATFKIPKKAKSNTEINTCPKKKLEQDDKKNCESGKEIVTKKIAQKSPVSPPPKKLNSNSVSTLSPKKDSLLSIISKAKNTITKSKESKPVPPIHKIKKQMNSNRESINNQSNHLSSAIGERRNYGSEQRRTLTLEEKIALHNVGKFKNSRSASVTVSSKHPTTLSSGSSARTFTPAATQKKLRPIIKAQKETSCKPSQAPAAMKVPVSPKKPISLEKYKERKMMDELFGESPKVEEKKLPEARKVVSFCESSCSKLDTKNTVSKKIEQSNETIKENPFGKLTLKPPSEKKLLTLSDINSAIPPPPIKSLTNTWSNIPSSSSVTNTNRPVGIVTPHQRIKPETSNEQKETKEMEKNKKEDANKSKHLKSTKDDIAGKSRRSSNSSSKPDTKVIVLLNRILYLHLALVIYFLMVLV